jgi:hypothetical protein
MVAAGPNPQKVVIRPIRGLALQQGDERIELIMAPGDAYVMDGLLQESYSHSILPEEWTLGNQNNAQRLAVLFRTGDERFVSEDSGRVCTDLPPRVKKQIHGSSRQHESWQSRSEL